MLLATGVKHEALRVLAETFEDNWDLVRDHVPVDPPEPPRVAHLFANALELIEAVCERTSESTVFDPLCERLEQLAAYVERLRGCADDVDLVEQVAENKPSFKASGCGKAPNWQDKQSVVADIRAAGEALDAAVDAVGQAAAAAHRHRASGHSRCGRPTSGGCQASSPSTTCSCSPARCSATPSTAPPSAPASTSGTPGCSSTSSRTPTRSRSSWPPASRPPIPARPRRARPSGSSSTSRPATSSWSATRSSRSTGSVGPTSACSWRPGTVSARWAAGWCSSRPTSVRAPRSSAGSTPPSAS